jgi:hypothetical protein
MVILFLYLIVNFILLSASTDPPYELKNLTLHKNEVYEINLDYYFSGFNSKYSAESTLNEDFLSIKQGMEDISYNEYFFHKTNMKRAVCIEYEETTILVIIHGEDKIQMLDMNNFYKWYTYNLRLHMESTSPIHKIEYTSDILHYTEKGELVFVFTCEVTYENMLIKRFFWKIFYSSDKAICSLYDGELLGITPNGYIFTKEQELNQPDQSDVISINNLFSNPFESSPFFCIRTIDKDFFNAENIKVHDLLSLNDIIYISDSENNCIYLVNFPPMTEELDLSLTFNIENYGILNLNLHNFRSPGNRVFLTSSNPESNSRVIEVDFSNNPYIVGKYLQMDNKDRVGINTVITYNFIYTLEKSTIDNQYFLKTTQVRRDIPLIPNERAFQIQNVTYCYLGPYDYWEDKVVVVTSNDIIIRKAHIPKLKINAAAISDDKITITIFCENEKNEVEHKSLTVDILEENEIPIRYTYSNEIDLEIPKGQIVNIEIDNLFSGVINGFTISNAKHPQIREESISYLDKIFIYEEEYFVDEILQRNAIFNGIFFQKLLPNIYKISSTLPTSVKFQDVTCNLFYYYPNTKTFYFSKCEQTTVNQSTSYYHHQHNQIPISHSQVMNFSSASDGMGSGTTQLTIKNFVINILLFRKKQQYFLYLYDVDFKPIVPRYLSEELSPNEFYYGIFGEPNKHKTPVLVLLGRNEKTNKGLVVKLQMGIEKDIRHSLIFVSFKKEISYQFYPIKAVFALHSVFVLFDNGNVHLLSLENEFEKLQDFTKEVSGVRDLYFYNSKIIFITRNNEYVVYRASSPYSYEFYSRFTISQEFELNLARQPMIAFVEDTIITLLQRKMNEPSKNKYLLQVWKINENIQNSIYLSHEFDYKYNKISFYKIYALKNDNNLICLLFTTIGIRALAIDLNPIMIINTGMDTFTNILTVSPSGHLENEIKFNITEVNCGYYIENKNIDPLNAFHTSSSLENKSIIYLDSYATGNYFKIEDTKEYEFKFGVGERDFFGASRPKLFEKNGTLFNYGEDSVEATSIWTRKSEIIINPSQPLTTGKILELFVIDCQFVDSKSEYCYIIYAEESDPTSTLIRIFTKDEETLFQEIHNQEIFFANARFAYNENKFASFESTWDGLNTICIFEIKDEIYYQKYEWISEKLRIKLLELSKSFPIIYILTEENMLIIRDYKNKVEVSFDIKTALGYVSFQTLEVQAMTISNNDHLYMKVKNSGVIIFAMPVQFNSQTQQFQFNFSAFDNQIFFYDNVFVFPIYENAEYSKSEFVYSASDGKVWSLTYKREGDYEYINYIIRMEAELNSKMAFSFTLGQYILIGSIIDQVFINSNLYGNQGVLVFLSKEDKLNTYYKLITVLNVTFTPILIFNVDQLIANTHLINVFNEHSQTTINLRMRRVEEYQTPFVFLILCLVIMLGVLILCPFFRKMLCRCKRKQNLEES